MLGGLGRGSSAPALGALGCVRTRFRVPAFISRPSPVIRYWPGSGLLLRSVHKLRVLPYGQSCSQDSAQIG